MHKINSALRLSARVPVKSRKKMTKIRDFKIISLNQDDNAEITYKNERGIHPDLSEAMQGLAPHVLRLLDLPDRPDFRVIGYYKQNVGDARLITIYCRLGATDERDKGIASLAARLYLGRDDYAAVQQLLEAMDACEHEVSLYINDGKGFESDEAIAITDEDLLELGEEVDHA